MSKYAGHGIITLCILPYAKKKGKVIASSQQRKEDGLRLAIRKGDSKSRKMAKHWQCGTKVQDLSD